MNGDVPVPRRFPPGNFGGTIHDWLNTGFMALLAGLFTYACAHELNLFGM